MGNLGHMPFTVFRWETGVKREVESFVHFTEHLSLNNNINGI